MAQFPTLKQMQYLIALKQTGSFSTAAEKCYVTQSTLSAGIAAMENILGQEVVDRNYRKARLTPFGQEIIGKIKTIIETSENIVEHAQNTGAPMTGILKIGIIPTIAPYMLPEIVKEIQNDFPDLHLHLQEDISEKLIEKIHSGDLDVALMAFPYKSDKTEQLSLFDEEFVLAAPTGLYPANDKISIKQLNNHNILLLNDGHCLRDHALEACKLDIKPGSSTFSATSLITLIQMVEQGNGATLLPEMAIKHLHLSKQTSLIRFRNPAPKRTIGLCWLKNNRKKQDFITIAEYIRTIHSKNH